jgi:hypothetical protein
LVEFQVLKKRMRNLRGLPEGLGQFYWEIFTIQLEALAQLACQNGHWLVPTPEKFKACQGKGEPLMANSLPPLVAGLVRKTATELVAAIDWHVLLVTKIVGSPPQSFPTLLERVLGYINHLAAQYGLVVWRIPPEDREKAAEALEAFVAFAALVPAYVSYAKIIEQNYDLSAWERGYCPVCGLPPVMAKVLPQGGKRVAECWLCATQWPIGRLRCPFCDNGEPERLGIIYLEENPATRMHLCMQCHRYLKVVDMEKKTGPVILALENLASWRLDQVAQTKGYLPGAGGAVLPGFPRY